jgi:hypothetical protein
MYLVRIFPVSLFMLSLFCNATPFSKARVKHKHPFYVSVSQVRENTKDRMLEVTCKIFTDDLEKELRKNYHAPVDLLNQAGRPAMGKLINDYIKGHLKISADGRECVLQYVGFEQDEEAVDCYFQVVNIKVNKTVDIINSILFDYKPEQVNIVHVTVRGTRKSTQLVNPDSKASFDFP